MPVIDRIRTLENRDVVYFYIAPVALIFIQACIIFRFYINNAAIPDEIIFLETARSIFENKNAHFIYSFDNIFGYGSLYWYIEYVFFLFNDPLIAARIFYFSILISCNILFLLIIWQWNLSRALAATLFYLATPMLWWQGKITGPEPLSHSFLIFSLASIVLIRSPISFMIGGVFFGLSCGVKLSTVPMIFLISSILYVENHKSLKSFSIQYMVFLFSIGVGFLIANPFLIPNPEKIISPYYVTNATPTHTIIDIIFGDKIVWDSVRIGSLTVFGMPILITFLSIFVLTFSNVKKEPIIGWCLAIISAIFLATRTPNFFGWYFYSQIMTFPLLIALPARTVLSALPSPVLMKGLKFPQLPSIYVTSCVTTLGLLALILNLSTILDMLNNKNAHIQQMTHVNEFRSKFRNIVSGYKPDLIVDFGEFNLSIATNEEKAPLSQDSQLIGLYESRKYEGFKWLLTFDQNFIKNNDGSTKSCSTISTFSRVLIISGDRISRTFFYINGSFVDWIKKYIIDECPGWRIVYQNAVHGMQFVVIENISTWRFPDTVSDAPNFESTRKWGPQAKAGGVVVGPGADNPNVFAQLVNVDPLTSYKIVAKVQQAGQNTATGRLQINWIDRFGHYISTSSKTIEASNDIRDYELIVLSPENARAGYLYVSPHAPGDTVRFLEMSLKGPARKPHADETMR